MSRGSLLRALAADEPRIEEVALAIAADAYPSLDVPRALAELDAFAEPIVARVSGASDSLGALEILNARLFDELGFHGNEDSYYDPRNSYLNEVIERRVGIPISLAIVMIAVGRRAGLVLEGVGFPGHFLVRVGGADGLFADPFHRGRVLFRDDLLRLAERFNAETPRGRPGDPVSRAKRRDVEALEVYLRPVDARAIAVRMLANLKHAYERGGHSAPALVICDRLVDVAGEPHHRRDRGRHALALGANRAARVDLSAYLGALPDAHDSDEIRALLAAATRNETHLN